MNNTTKLKTIDSELSVVPTFQCKTGCSDCCGPVMMTRLEALRIYKATGKNPMAGMDTLAEDIKAGKDIHCQFLDQQTHRCAIYEIRPAVCRVFGSSEHPRLTCPHGCQPAVKLTKSETKALMHRVDALGL